jgi:flagellar biosynthesis protein FlhG
MKPIRTHQACRTRDEKHTGGDAIVVVSGKGGVGKTNLALNLGIQLSRRDQRVILMDADFGLANADILMNVAPLGNVADLIDAERWSDRLLVQGPGGLRVLCGVSSASDPGRHPEIDPRASVHALHKLQQRADTVLVDCGAGLSATIVALALAGDLLVLVTTPEPTALADSYATLKLLAQRGLAGPVALVVNMARSRHEAGAVARRLTRVARQFLGLSIECLGHIPTDRHVPQAVRSRVPVCVRHPNCIASLAMERICEQLVPEATARAPAGNVWSRVAGLFL